jgi:succinoglycan biosynthesis protein ExoI
MRTLFLTAALLAGCTTATAAERTGRATVLDGDTIEVRGERIRLHGIDVSIGTQTGRRIGVGP